MNQDNNEKNRAITNKIKKYLRNKMIKKYFYTLIFSIIIFIILLIIVSNFMEEYLFNALIIGIILIVSFPLCSIAYDELQKRDKTDYYHYFLLGMIIIIIIYFITIGIIEKRDSYLIGGIIFAIILIGFVYYFYNLYKRERKNKVKRIKEWLYSQDDKE